VAVADQLVDEHNFHFGGIDFSLAPYPDQATSIGAAIERLGIDRFGGSGTLFGAACIYLLVGFAFTILYRLVEQLSPGSFETASAGPADWPTFLNGNGRVGVTSDPLPQQLQLKWVYKTPAPPEMAAGTIARTRPASMPGSILTSLFPGMAQRNSP